MEQMVYNLFVDSIDREKNRSGSIYSVLCYLFNVEVKALSILFVYKF